MKKGFTLIEVMAVIAIMGILVVLVVPNLIDARRDITDKTFEGVKRQLENAAIEWGEDHLNDLSLTPSPSNSNITECAYVTVNSLISHGYIAGDNEDKTLIKDPTNKKENLNENKICVYFDISNGISHRVLKSEYVE